jgi:hypothetical protein
MKGNAAVTAKPDVASEAIKAVPPLVIVAAEKVGEMHLQDWVYVATLIYIALQAGWLLWRWWRAVRSKNWTPKD